MEEFFAALKFSMSNLFSIQWNFCFSQLLSAGRPEACIDPLALGSVIFCLFVCHFSIRSPMIHTNNRKMWIIKYRHTENLYFCQSQGFVTEIIFWFWKTVCKYNYIVIEQQLHLLTSQNSIFTIYQLFKLFLFICKKNVPYSTSL